MHVIRKLVAALTVAGVCSAASAAGNLVIDPASSLADIGDAFSVRVMGTAFTEIVVGGGFNLSFNPAFLALSSVAINTSIWEFSPLTGTIDNTAGTLSNVAFNTFLGSPTGNFEVATLNFQAKAPGTSALTLSGSPSFPFASILGEVINVSYGTGQATVNAVPEPATVVTMLLGLGLLPLALRRRT